MDDNGKKPNENITNMQNRIIIELYNDIQKHIPNINAWHDIKMFDFPMLSNIETEKLEQTSAINISFPSIGSKREQTYFDQKIKSFNLFVKDYLLESTNYMYLMEYKLNVLQKIRSHKGLFYKKNIENCIQKEYLINKPYSIIAAILPLNEENIDLFTQLYDADCAFVVSSEFQSLSLEKTLDDLVTNYIHLSSSKNVINYASIIANYCNEGNKIYRIMGDWEESFIFQIFCMKPQATSLISRIKQLIANIFPDTQVEIYSKQKIHD